MDNNRNQFIIVTVSNNNEMWVDDNLDSVLSQDYPNYKLIYFDNWSTDKTAEKVLKKVAGIKRFSLYQDPERIYKPGFLYKLEKIVEINDKDIIVFLDGDDIFACDNVLSYLNEIYNKSQCWMTYGGMVVWEGDDKTSEPFPQNSEIPFLVRQTREYRKDLWRTSHLKSMRGFVWKALNKEDFKPDGKFEIITDDLVMMFGALELCPPEKVYRITDPVYVFNNSPATVTRRQTTAKDCQANAPRVREMEIKIRNREKYSEIPIVTPTLAGGVGNQMFEIAAAASLAKDNKAILVLNPNEHILPNQGRNVKTYTENLFRNIILDDNPNVKSIYKWSKPTYSPIPFQPNLKLDGHFQSYKYFDHNRDYIVKLFSIPEFVLENISKKYSIADFNRTTGIQVRRGDYYKFPDYHPLLPLDYYNRAVQMANPEKLMIFSDDIEWCKEKLRYGIPTQLPTMYVKEDDYIELYMLSMCRNIIISNSSFGWWSSYLSNGSNVYSPPIWFGNAVINDGFIYDDLILPEWNIVK